MDRPKELDVAIGDEVAIERAGKVLIGHVGHLNNGHCVIVVAGQTTQGGWTEPEVMVLPVAELSPFGPARWAAHVSLSGIEADQEHKADNGSWRYRRQA